MGVRSSATALSNDQIASINNIPAIAQQQAINTGNIATNTGNITTLLGVPTQYVSNSPMTVANLIANFPPSSTVLGMYAHVTDLYGSVDDIMRCRFDGTNYRWVPQRDSMTGTNAATGGTVTLTPLVTPPVLRLTGNLLSNVSLTPSATNAYYGQKFTIVNNATLNLLVANITGLIGSNVTILGSGSRDIVYGSSGWFAAN